MNTSVKMEVTATTPEPRERTTQAPSKDGYSTAIFQFAGLPSTQNQVSPSARTDACWPGCCVEPDQIFSRLTFVPCTDRSPMMPEFVITIASTGALVVAVSIAALAPVFMTATDAPAPAVHSFSELRN